MPCHCFNALTFAVDNDLDFRYEVHGKADVSGEFTERADGLGIHLLALDFEADLFSQSSGDIAGGDGTVEFSGFTSLGREDEGHIFDQVGNTLEFAILGIAADLSLRFDLLNLLHCTFGGENGKSLRKEEVSSVTIGNFLDVSSASEFVNVFDK